MKIGIIVHSKSGTTLKFGKIIEKKLRDAGYPVELINLTTNVPVKAGSVRQNMDFIITNQPEAARYDVLLLGGPVWGFSASPVIINCINRLEGVSQKKVLPFVTMGFPFLCMGGKQAVKLMSKTLSKSGAEVLPGKIIPQLFRKVDLLMAEAAADILAMMKKLD